MVNILAITTGVYIKALISINNYSLNISTAVEEAITQELKLQTPINININIE